MAVGDGYVDSLSPGFVTTLTANRDETRKNKKRNLIDAFHNYNFTNTHFPDTLCFVGLQGRCMTKKVALYGWTIISLTLVAGVRVDFFSFERQGKDFSTDDSSMFVYTLFCMRGHGFHGGRPFL